jgi:hypothetical protein
MQRTIALDASFSYFFVALTDYFKSLQKSHLWEYSRSYVVAGESFSIHADRIEAMATYFSLSRSCFAGLPLARARRDRSWTPERPTQRFFLKKSAPSKLLRKRPLYPG